MNIKQELELLIEKYKDKKFLTFGGKFRKYGERLLA